MGKLYRERAGALLIIFCAGVEAGINARASHWSGVLAWAVAMATWTWVYRGVQRDIFALRCEELGLEP